MTKYAYTKQGDVASVQYADGKTVAMSYNASRQLTQVNDWLGQTKIEVDPLGRTTKVVDHNKYVVQYACNSLGQRAQMIYPNGAQVNYSYDKIQTNSNSLIFHKT